MGMGRVMSCGGFREGAGGAFPRHNLGWCAPAPASVSHDSPMYPSPQLHSPVTSLQVPLKPQEPLPHRCCGLGHSSLMSVYVVLPRSGGGNARRSGDLGDTGGGGGGSAEGASGVAGAGGGGGGDSGGGSGGAGA